MGANEARSDHDEAFAFVTALAKELSGGKIELPAIPDIAERVRVALDDDRVSADKLERIVSAEPVLAGRLVQLANSAALNFSGKKVTDLRTAIARIGFAMVRTTSVAYALSQLRKAEKLKNMREPLNALWKRSTIVAAACRVVSVRLSRVNPDMAMLAGLLHGIGELYLLARISDYPSLVSTDGGRAIIRDWQSAVAKAILENWEIDATITAAVAEFETLDREHTGPVDLTDVLTIGFLLGSYMNHPDSLEANMADVKICQRLGLTRVDYEALISSSREQMDALREALDY
jgi:HD-like signal output (HDOD) protein